jgi:tol-pal system protein YbgF
MWMNVIPPRFSKSVRAAFLWLAPLMLIACMADMEAMRADIEGLKQVSFHNQQKVRELEGTASSLQEDLKVFKENTKDLPKEESITALRDSQTSLFSQVSDMLRELQVISGRFDEHKYFIDKNLKKASAELEVVKSKLDGIAAMGDSEELNNRLAAIEADITLLKGQIEALKGLTKSIKEEPGPAPPAPEQIYEAAYDTFKEKKYKEAREKMQGFIRENPGHKLAGNAAFWIGETYYMEGAYEDSILAYEDVLQKYKDNPKVPAAMLKQAYSFLELGDAKAAKVILNDLIKNYPKDETAKAAKSKLQGIK